MTSNTAFDQDRLLADRNGQSSTHDKANIRATDPYGTFSDSAGRFPTTTTTTSSYPDGFASQSSMILVLGGCPACKTGILQTDFTFLGICCAIFFFPIGIICCLAFRQRRCNFCGAIYP